MFLAWITKTMLHILLVIYYVRSDGHMMLGLTLFPPLSVARGTNPRAASYIKGETGPKSIVKALIALGQDFSDQVVYTLSVHYSRLVQIVDILGTHVTSWLDDQSRALSLEQHGQQT